MDNIKENRDKYIGGSDVPIILGYATKYGQTPYKLARIKAGIDEDTFEGNEYTRFGEAIEPKVRERINSLKSADYKYVPDTKICEIEGFRGNTDGYSEVNRELIEIKTYGKSFDVDYHLPQCHFYAWLWDATYTTLFAYKRPDDFNTDFDKNRLSFYAVPFDQAKWDKWYAQIKRFQTALAAMRENPDMTEAEFALLSNANELTALSNKVAELESYLEAAKSVQAEYDDVKSQLYEQMDKHGVKSFDTGQWKITMVAPAESKKDTLDANKLKKEKPEIYNSYVVEKVTKRKGYVRVTKKGEL